eukprot:GSChrysophyteH1.ASY1.ANO1.263.1 assembled CDS
MSAFSSLKIAIVGTGSVGSSLGGNLLKAGHTVVFGARDPSSEKTQAAVAKLPGATVLSVTEAVAGAEAVILAVPGMRTQEQYNACAASLGAGAEGKVVIDATNPLTAFPELAVLWDGNTSGGEMCAAALPKSAVFKAFNTTGAENMRDPTGQTGALHMLFAGDKTKVDTAAAVISGVGFTPKYVGPIRYARNLESIAELWIHLGFPPAGETKENWGQAFHFQVVDSRIGDA